MAIPTRTDGASIPARTLGRRPIVLARLPHVCATQGQVDLDIVGVQDAVMLEPEGDILANHFVDPGHSENELALAALPESTSERSSSHSRSRRHKKRSSRSEKSRPITTFQQKSDSTQPSTFLVDLHSQLAPFAGAIVALALIASAGLLYWMIVSPSQMATEFQGESQLGFEASIADLPKFVPELPSFSSRSSKAVLQETNADAEPSVFEFPEWNDEVATEESLEPLAEMPAQALQEQELMVTLEKNAADSEPKTEAAPVIALEQVASPVIELDCVTTNSPKALDFSKIGVTAEIKTQTDSPQNRPSAEVASRSAPHVLVPTKR